MTYYLTYLRDTIGNNYVGINIPNEVVEPHLEKLKETLGVEMLGVGMEAITQEQ